MPPGKDVANLTVLRRSECYTVSAPLEAASIGIDLKDDDAAFRCNLVTLSQEQDYFQKSWLTTAPAI